MSSLVSEVGGLVAQLDMFEVVAWAFLFSTWTIVSLRIYARAYLVRIFGADDWTMVFAQVSRIHHSLVVIDATIDEQASSGTQSSAFSLSFR